MNDEKNNYVEDGEYDDHSNFIKNSRERIEYNNKTEEISNASVNNDGEQNAEKLSLISFVIILAKRFVPYIFVAFSFIPYLTNILNAILMMAVVASYVVIIANKIKYPNNKKIKTFFWISIILLIVEVVLAIFALLFFGMLALSCTNG
mgnify:FL=1